MTFSNKQNPLDALALRDALPTGENQIFKDYQEKFLALKKHLPLKNLQKVIYLYRVYEEDLPLLHFRAEEASLGGVILYFQDHQLEIIWQGKTDEIELSLSQADIYADKHVISLGDELYFFTNASGTPLWQRLMGKDCDWLWYVLNSHFYTDAIQLALGNLENNLQFLALNEIKIFSLHRENPEANA